MIFDISPLNQPQQVAARTVEGPLLILAGAGSGKTRTVTFRIAHMVLNMGIDPKTILAVSFTNKAAQEMRERVEHLVGKRQAREMTLSTFHALGLTILKEEITLLGMKRNFSIYDTSDQMSIIKEALKYYKGGQAFDRKIILSKIGTLKNKGVSAEEFSKTTLFDPDGPYDLVTEYAYNFYQEKLKFYNAVDFDDILFLTVRLFRSHPLVAEKYSKKFQYIMVDEYQDTNPLQFEMVRALTSTHHNLCVVGDDDQSIYAFRGADLSNILEFEKSFPGAKVIKLEQNYRSLAPILELANQVIAQNKNRKEKKLWSDQKSDIKPFLWATGDSDHEAQVVVEDIVQYQTKGNKLSDLAILYRSNTQVDPFEDQLRMSNVPYQILGGQKLYDKKEVKDLIAYLSVIQNVNDEIALRRILNVPNRGIGQASLNKFLLKSDQDKCSLFSAIEKAPELGHNQGTMKSFTLLIRELQQEFKSKPLPEALQSMISKIEYLPFVEKEYSSVKQVDARKADVQRFVMSAERFTQFFETKTPLKDFIERVLLQDSQDKKDDEAEKPNTVTLMTLHSSKGLEFDQVYIVGMEEELLPHKRTTAEGEDISEERRLTYVGITRARKKLIMTYAKKRKLYGVEKDRLKSRFLLGLEDFYTTLDRTTFSHLSTDEVKDYKKSFFKNLMDGLD